MSRNIPPDRRRLRTGNDVAPVLDSQGPLGRVKTPRRGATALRGLDPPGVGPRATRNYRSDAETAQLQVL